MKTNKQLITSFTAIIFLMAATFLTACSKSEKPDSSGSGLGTMTLEVTGEVNGSFKGMADFNHLKVSQTESWSIAGHDMKPQTFSLDITAIGNQFTSNTIGRPEPGNYSIGGMQTADYQATFTHIVDEDFYNSNGKNVTYTTTYLNEGQNGTLTITSSTEETVKGTFSFTAHPQDTSSPDASSKTVQIQGEFTAHKRK